MDPGQVRLPDLEVIRRFSIAVRREHASVEEVLDALRADLATIERAIKPPAPVRAPRPVSAARRSRPARRTRR